MRSFPLYGSVKAPLATCFGRLQVLRLDKSNSFHCGKPRDTFSMPNETQIGIRLLQMRMQYTITRRLYSSLPILRVPAIRHVGDVYVDLLCYSPSSSSSLLMLNGSDSTLIQTIAIMAEDLGSIRRLV